MRENRQLTKKKSAKKDEFYMLYDFSYGSFTTSRVRYGYDTEGRIATLAATSTNGTEVVREFYAYDHEGRVTVVTNALGNVTTTEYDARGNAVAVGGAAYPVRKSYDSENRQISLRTTRDGGATWDETTWVYDDLTGLLLAKTYADGSQMTYTYTPDGLPARTTYPGGKWKELVYDSNRNVTNILHTARSTPNTAFLHDAFGNVTNAIDTAGNSWQFAYSANSTLTNEVFTSLRLCDSACQTNALARLIDAYFRPVGYNLAIGDTPRSRTRYGYDNEGRIATLAATNAANRGFQVTYLNEAGYNYGYTLTTPNGATLTRTVTRDPYRRSLTLDCTTRFNNVVVASFVYTFDAHNRPVARNNDRFAYNDRDEITSALIGTNRINRAYDTIGNHVFCAYNAATNFYANNQLNQTVAQYGIVSHGGTEPRSGGDESLWFTTNSLTWSAQGGLQRDGRFIYAFDAEDQLVSVTSAALTNGAIRVVNAYDYRHRRISKTVYSMRDDSLPPSPLAPPSPIVHRTWYLQEHHDFVYDDWNLIHETVTSIDANSSTNVAEIEYFWGPDLSNTLHGAGGIGGLLAVSRNGQFYFPVYDNNGNIIRYLDEFGIVVATYNYDDFGQMIEKIGSMTKVFRILFSTRYRDEETSLQCYPKRFYQPILRTWINRDSIFEDGGENLYEMVLNSPLEFYDPLGDILNWHHMLPQQFSDKFMQTGLDIHSAEFGYILDDVDHTGRGGVHSSWNGIWRNYFEMHPKATKKEILAQLEMMKSLPNIKTRLAKGTPAKVSFKVWHARGRKVLEKTSQKCCAKKIGKRVPLISIIFLAHDVKAKGWRNGVVNSLLDACPYVGWVKCIDEFQGGEWFPDLD